MNRYLAKVRTGREAGKRFLVLATNVAEAKELASLYIGYTPSVYKLYPSAAGHLRKRMPEVTRETLEATR